MSAPPRKIATSPPTGNAPPTQLKGMFFVAWLLCAAFYFFNMRCAPHPA